MSYFKYDNKDLLKFEIDESTFLGVMGDSNKKIVDDLTNKQKTNYVYIDSLCYGSKERNELGKKIAFVLNQELNIFVGETVRDEIAYGMESKALKPYQITEAISKFSYFFNLDDLLERDPNSLGTSDKVKVKLVSALSLETKILVLDEVLEELDKKDLEKVISYLKEYVEKGNIVINFSNNIEEALFSDKLVIANKQKVVVEGKTINVLNQEKIMKRLGLSLPFITDLSKMLMDYDVVKKYYFDIEGLVKAIWK